mmetsp:Transcript_22050/g.35859  ORF Transcript_22050/g.35859 Transcript_22050/m.35859 type:complete len:82 (-) Transcript_22050:346-591(-)
MPFKLGCYVQFAAKKVLEYQTSKDIPNTSTYFFSRNILHQAVWPIIHVDPSFSLDSSTFVAVISTLSSRKTSIHLTQPSRE